MTREPDFTRRCWCDRPGGCTFEIIVGTAGSHLCPICKKAGHRAYTQRQIDHILAKRKEVTQ